MKTHVIQVEAHDDVISIRDRMAWAKTGRILLVFPARQRGRIQTLDLRLLQRQAVSLGGQLAIVTRSRLLKDTARKLGLPVFPNASTAQRSAWEAAASRQALSRRQEPPDLRRMRGELARAEAAWRTWPSVRLGFFSLAVLALFFVLALLLPSATIALVPVTREQELSVPVTASTDVGTVRVTGSLPARLVSMTLERSGTTAASGTLDLPADKAGGVVRFENLTTGLVGIPAGTVVRTTASPAIRFATTEDAVLEAEVGAFVEIPVEALQAGSAGNLPAGALVAIEGGLGASLSASNPAPTTGGSEIPSPVQTAEDRQRLRASLTEAAAQACRDELPASLTEGDILFADTVTVGQVLSENFFPAEGQAGENLSLTLQVLCQARYASAAELQSLAVQALDANLPAGFEPVSAGAQAARAAQPVTDETGITRFEIRAWRTLRTAIDAGQLARSVLGRPVDEVETRLNAELALAQAPAVQIRPSFWPWMPVVPFRIAILEGE
jgi:hypothetical protein